MASDTALPREDLLRTAPGIIEIRAAAGDDTPTLSGHFSVFDTFYEIDSMYEGHFLERVAPGAFKKTFAENRDGIRVLFQHGQDPQIGDKVLGPIEDLREDDIGAFYSVPLLDTSYNRDLIPGLRAGLYGSSFRFKVMREDVVDYPKPSEQNPRGLKERTVREAMVREFGPVTFGASPTATSAVRSLTDEFLLPRFLDDPERLQRLLDAHKATRKTSVLIPADVVPADDDEARDADDKTPADQPETETTPTTETTELRENAPDGGSAEQTAHPAQLRRETGIDPCTLDRKETPSWLL